MSRGHASWGGPAYLRGVLVERGAAELHPGCVRPAGPVGTVSGLHPDAQRPPSLRPPWIGGPGSAAPLRSISAEDDSNLAEMCSAEEKKSRGGASVSPRLLADVARPEPGGGTRNTEAKQEQLTADVTAPPLAIGWRPNPLSLVEWRVFIGWWSGAGSTCVRPLGL